ncbi:MAG: LuxR C-terminal-related transcriptional regulator [Thermomicrobiales bacterium]
MSLTPDHRQVPHVASPFVGRDAELSRLKHMIDDPAIRLVTILGTAGVGKTRLAAEAVRPLADLPDHQVIFLPLATVDTPDLAIAEIARAHGIKVADPLAGMRAVWARMHGVVVLDNLEQIIDIAPTLATLITADAPMTILATSQRPLQIQGERVLRLEPLPVPAEESGQDDAQAAPSVQLFLNRAAEIDASLPDEGVPAETTKVIAEICRRLDGIPLAIELAASRMAALTPEVILDQLERDHQVLASPRRDLPARQRTMHSAIAWSFKLLPDDLRRVFLWLGVFPGGFDLPTVQHLADHLEIRQSALDIVQQLMDFSLVRRTEGGRDPWYMMLTSIREFCLAELDATQERADAEAFLADHVLARAEATEAAMTGPEAGRWIELLGHEQPNVRQAVSWALAHEDAVVPYQVVGGMRRYMLQASMHQEGIAWIDRAEPWSSSLPHRPLILGLLGKTSLLEGRRAFSDVQAISDQVTALLDAHPDPELQVRHLIQQGLQSLNRNRLDESADLLRRAAELARTHGFTRSVAVARTNLGSIELYRGNYAEAEAIWRDALDALVDLGDRIVQPTILSGLSYAADSQGAFDRAVAYAEQGIAISREAGLSRDEINCLINLGAPLIHLGEYEAATQAFEDSIALAQHLAYPYHEALGHAGLASISQARGDMATAAMLDLRAMDLMPHDDMSRLLPEIGLALVTMLVHSGSFPEAAALLERTDRYLEEIELTIGPYDLYQPQALWQEIEAALPDTSAARERGRSWSVEAYRRHMRAIARRIAGTRGPVAAMLVTIPPSAQTPPLTRREQEILHLLAEGYSTQRLADELSISPRTITTHIANMMGKYEVSSRTELVARPLRDGAIPGTPPTT